tara:strand:- start:2580 stop:5696 length:3117 start_codon:yes stop_codon:yes gene_type:complete
MNATRTTDHSSHRRGSSALICSILIVSILSATVLANDAGSGSDAGGTSSTALYLPANNSTYYGNLTLGSDTNDFYAINMSFGTGIAASISIPSNVDFDLILQSSGGAQIDSSTNGAGQMDNVTSNGTNVGGTTVYIWVDQYQGSGQYTMQIEIFSTGNGSVGVGDDAGSGQDAGGYMSSSLSLSSLNLAWTNNSTSFQGNLSTSNDDDWYSLNVTQGYGVYVEMYHDSGNDFDMWLYDSNGTQLDLAYSTSNPETMGSNGTDVGGSTVYIEIKDYPGAPSYGSYGSYNVTLQLFSIAGNPLYSQNDAGSGGDAGNDLGNATNLSIPQNTNSTTSFSGWKSSSDDNNDWYLFSVPADYGVEINMSSTNVTGYLVIYWGSNSSLIDYSINNNGAEYVTSTGPEVSGEDVLMRAIAASGSGPYNFTVNIFSLDADNDGWEDTTEVQCGTDPEDYNSTPSDFDTDGICDTMDPDDDNDGTNDVDDDFPQNPSETTDTDNDGIGNNADDDDDGDGWDDSEEADCNTNPLDYSSQPSDTDSDDLCNELDDDDDGDGYLDSDDDFPLDDSEWLDTDNDGIGNNIDTNDDSDGFSDEDEIQCGSDPLSYSSVPPDSDTDGICDIMDDDDDNDGYPDTIDQFPNNPQEWLDTDSDGQGDNSDFDDDNDGVIDEYDAFDTDPNEQYDFDGDGIGDNADTDDDGDGWSDSDESTCQSDPQDSISLPDDFDSDYTCDIMDSDDDGDGYEDAEDSFQFDATEWEDTDSDGIGNNQDDDDDGDGWTDIIEPNCGAEPLNAESSPVDTDDDGTCDFLDPDNDNDSVMDVDDDFPEDQNESKDTDRDGIGNNADEDDDDDGWPDSSELLCDTSPLSDQSVPEDTDMDGNCDLLDMDDDNDGVPDSRDVFPKDVNEWEDLNNDGLGDNGHPLSLADRMKLNPGISALAILVIVSLLGVLIYSNASSRGSITPILEIFSKKHDSVQSSDYSRVGAEKSPPPVPPGLVDEPENNVNYAKSWEDLPPGGQYTDSVPMRYQGEDCGIWEQRDDESWVRK